VAGAGSLSAALALDEYNAGPYGYLTLVEKAKAGLEVPVIASLNRVTPAPGSSTPPCWRRPAPTPLSSTCTTSRPAPGWAAPTDQEDHRAAPAPLAATAAGRRGHPRRPAHRRPRSGSRRACGPSRPFSGTCPGRCHSDRRGGRRVATRKVRFQLAVSLDAYVAGPEQSEDNPLGVGDPRSSRSGRSRPGGRHIRYRVVKG
jgi:hypothetical protein